MCEGLLFSYQVYTFLFLMTFVCILNKDTIYICKGIILLDTIPKLLLRLFSLQPRLSPCPLRSVWCRLLCLHLQSESDLKQNSKVILTHTAKIWNKNDCCYLLHVIVRPTFFQMLDRKTTELSQNQISGLAFHSIFHRFRPSSGRLLFYSLTKQITLKICWFCLVLINSILFNLSCVWISLIVHPARPSFMFQAAGDVQWNASCSQPYHVGAELSVAHTCPVMAKCNTQSFTQPYSRTELSMVHIHLMMAKRKCTTCAQPKFSLEHFARVKMVPKLLLRHSWNTNMCIVCLMNCPLIPGHG